MKTSQKGFIAPLLALIAILLIGGGAYVYVQNKQANQSAVGTVTPSQPTSTAQTSDAQTADWKTYDNTKFHYSIKYPSDLTLSFETQYVPVPSDQSSSFTLANFKFEPYPVFRGLFNPGQMMIVGDTYDASSCGSTTDGPEYTKVTVDGVKGVKYVNIATGGDNEVSYYGYSFPKITGGSCLAITLLPYPTDTVFIQKFDQVVSTLKFSP